MIRRLFAREERIDRDVESHNNNNHQETSQRVRVAFQGEPGAYSFEAAHAYFGEAAEFCPFPQFVDVCNAVVAGQVNYGILPVANSQTGSMPEMEQMLKRVPVDVIGTIDYPIHHCLVCLPGQQLHDIVLVISHPQALAQCSRYLERLQIQITPTANTAASAKMIRDKRLKGFAAVASMSTSRLYELEILALDIQNTQNNTTRFVAFQKPYGVRLIEQHSGGHIPVPSQGSGSLKSF